MSSRGSHTTVRRVMLMLIVTTLHGGVREPDTPEG